MGRTEQVPSGPRQGPQPERTDLGAPKRVGAVTVTVFVGSLHRVATPPGLQYSSRLQAATNIRLAMTTARTTRRCYSLSRITIRSWVSMGLNPCETRRRS